MITVKSRAVDCLSYYHIHIRIFQKNFDPYVLWPLAKKFGQTKKNVYETQKSADKHGEKLQLLRWMLEKKVWRPPTSLFRRGHGIVNTTEFLNQILTHRILALGKKRRRNIQGYICFWLDCICGLKYLSEGPSIKDVGISIFGGGRGVSNFNVAKY